MEVERGPISYFPYSHLRYNLRGVQANMERDKRVLHAKIDLPPRIKKGKRTLDFSKCRFCRNSKKKCEPQERQWPGERCQRCLQKGFECSAPQRKRYICSLGPSETPNDRPSMSPSGSGSAQSPSVSVQSTSFNPYTVSPDAVDSSHVHAILSLLSIRTLTLMALTELRTISKALLPATDDLHYQHHRKRIESTFIEYTDLCHRIEQHIQRFPFSDPLVLSAVMECFTSTDATMAASEEDMQAFEDRIESYQNSSHHGLAYILQLKSLLLQLPAHTDKEAARLLFCRGQFFENFKKFLSEDFIELYRSNRFAYSQLFIPCRLIKIPSIRKHIMETVPQDFLGRAFVHMVFDGEVLPVRWKAESLVRDRWNVPDVLGRSIAHLFALRGILISPRFPASVLKCTTVNGLNPLHLLVMGHRTHLCTEIFNDCSDYRNAWDELMYATDCAGCTPIDVAAKLGYEDIVKVLANRWRNPQSNEVAIRLAARNGHFAVVNHLAASGFAADSADDTGRTAYWYAVQRSHYRIVRVLESFAGVDHKDKDGRTPLAEAARQGNAMKLRYLLDLNTQATNDGAVAPPVNPNSRDNEGKTPLILAAEAGQNECVELLHAHPSFVVDEGELLQAADIASKRGDSELSEKLLGQVVRFRQDAFRDGGEVTGQE
ncbi:ankyrin [Zopfia rhizophila CBS 207.26]|uniref:Ankyrin n=1 Tax=Zopfia rhizophila CBS 207.26 TaxID=1314779 RepID=A0A6A6EN18_9PEZI|nr:ankyrin [Zopfia rhizophila CBS 207.26]